MPVIVPPLVDDADIDRVLDMLDGFVLVGGADLDPQYELIVVLFNARAEATTFTAPAVAGRQLRLHPMQANGSDPLVKQATYHPDPGTWTIPRRTTAVFVQPQR